jgi:hypothetical protein
VDLYERWADSGYVVGNLAPKLSVFAAMPWLGTGEE